MREEVGEEEVGERGLLPYLSIFWMSHCSTAELNLHRPDTSDPLAPLSFPLPFSLPKTVFFLMEDISGRRRKRQNVLFRKKLMRVYKCVE